MTFIDSNIPMYLVGADHPNKQLAAVLVERAIAEESQLVTSVEVLQEILHRYAAIGRLQAIEPAIDLLLDLVDEVFDITLSDALRAAEILQSALGISARDALHIAVMERHSVPTIMSLDRGFDRWAAIQRIG